MKGIVTAAVLSCLFATTCCLSEDYLVQIARGQDAAAQPPAEVNTHMPSSKPFYGDTQFSAKVTESEEPTVQHLRLVFLAGAIANVIVAVAGVLWLVAKNRSASALSSGALPTVPAKHKCPWQARIIGAMGIVGGVAGLAVIVLSLVPRLLIPREKGWNVGIPLQTALSWLAYHFSWFWMYTKVAVVLGSLLCLAWIVVGLQLWRRKRTALVAAKILLACQIPLHVFQAIFLFAFFTVYFPITDRGFAWISVYYGITMQMTLSALGGLAVNNVMLLMLLPHSVRRAFASAAEHRTNSG